MELTIRPFKTADREKIIELWRQCGLVKPWNDPVKDADRKLTVQPELFLVGELNGEIVASVMAGYKGHRGWANDLAVDPNHRRKGLAQQLMREVEKQLIDLGCPKINVQIRSNHVEVIEFYQAIGFTEDQAVSFGKRLIKDD